MKTIYKTIEGILKKICFIEKNPIPKIMINHDKLKGYLRNMKKQANKK